MNLFLNNKNYVNIMGNDTNVRRILIEGYYDTKNPILLIQNLLNKLIDKGILSEKEVIDLVEESAKESN